MKIRILLALLLCLALTLSAVACAAEDTGAASSEAVSAASAASEAASVDDTSADASSEEAVSSAMVKDYSRHTILLADDPSLWRITGRTYEVNAADGRRAMCFDMGGMGFHFTAECEGDVSLKISMKTSANNGGKNYQHFLVRVDGEGTDVTVNGSTSEAVRTLPLATGLSKGRHTFEVYRCNEGYCGIASLVSVELNGWMATYQAPQRDLKMVFLGDSITVGLGINAERGADNQKDNDMSDATKSYAFLTGEALNADFSMVAIGGMNCSTYPDADDSSCYHFYENYSKFRNPKVTYGNTAETDVDVYVISLGTNDTNQTNGKYNNSEETIHAYVTALIQRVRADHPNAKIVWTYGQLHTDRYATIRDAVNKLAETDEKLYYFQYKTTNTQGGSWHPTAEAQAQQAEELIAFLRENVL